MSERVKSQGKINKKQRLAKRNYRKDPCLPSALSAWAENFTAAKTWQLNYQLAYWKAMAISLHHQNSMWHEVAQRNHIAVPTTSRKNSLDSDSELDGRTEDSETTENDADCTDRESENDENQNDNEGDDIEVSEEYIKFLTDNAKYREDARRERERLKALEEEYQTQSEVPSAQESVEDIITRKKELYGDKYQKIMALEMSVALDFKNESEKLKPAYWPNIPLNLNSS